MESALTLSLDSHSPPDVDNAEHGSVLQETPALFPHALPPVPDDDGFDDAERERRWNEQFHLLTREVEVLAPEDVYDREQRVRMWRDHQFTRSVPLSPSPWMLHRPGQTDESSCSNQLPKRRAIGRISISVPPPDPIHRNVLMNPTSTRWGISRATEIHRQDVLDRLGLEQRQNRRTLELLRPFEGQKWLQRFLPSQPEYQHHYLSPLSPQFVHFQPEPVAHGPLAHDLFMAPKWLRSPIWTFAEDADFDAEETRVWDLPENQSEPRRVILWEQYGSNLSPREWMRQQTQAAISGSPFLGPISTHNQYTPMRLAANGEFYTFVEFQEYYGVMEGKKLWRASFQYQILNKTYQKFVWWLKFIAPYIREHTSCREFIEKYEERPWGPGSVISCHGVMAMIKNFVFFHPENLQFRLLYHFTPAPVGLITHVCSTATDMRLADINQTRDIIDIVEFTRQVTCFFAILGDQNQNVDDPHLNPRGFKAQYALSRDAVPDSTKPSDWLTAQWMQYILTILTPLETVVMLWQATKKWQTICTEARTEFHALVREGLTGSVTVFSEWKTDYHDKNYIYRCVPGIHHVILTQQLRSQRIRESMDNIVEEERRFKERHWEAGQLSNFNGRMFRRSWTDVNQQCQDDQYIRMIKQFSEARRNLFVDTGHDAVHEAHRTDLQRRIHPGAVQPLT